MKISGTLTTPSPKGSLRSPKDCLRRTRHFTLISNSIFSGVDVIKLEPNRTYEFDAISKMMGAPDPRGGVYSAEESSILISMIAYKCCLEFAKQERFEAGMRKYQEGLITLEQSQLQKEIVKDTFFSFK